MFGEKFLKIDFDSKKSKGAFFIAGLVGSALSGGNVGVGIAIAGVREAAKKAQEDIRKYEPTSFKDFMDKSFQNMSAASWWKETKDVSQLAWGKIRNKLILDDLKEHGTEFLENLNDQSEELKIDILSEEEMETEEEQEADKEEELEENEEEQDEEEPESEEETEEEQDEEEPESEEEMEEEQDEEEPE
ncbi:hypothetical protein, partial [Priestia megaterium]|uniref:hypothetical protein n=1 Tax=Priestia megaterium TaxID=1404 RepID=UPI0039EAD9F8